MTRITRTLVVALIAVIAAWSAAQSASATTMALEMAAMAADEPAIAMPDCNACPSDEAAIEGGSACDPGCVPPLLAALYVSLDEAADRAVSLPDALLHVRMAERSISPDPFPPRVIPLF